MVRDLTSEMWINVIEFTILAVLEFLERVKYVLLDPIEYYLVSRSRRLQKNLVYKKNLLMQFHVCYIG